MNHDDPSMFGGAHARFVRPFYNNMMPGPSNMQMRPQFFPHHRPMNPGSSNDQAAQFHQQRQSQPAYVFTSELANRAEQEVSTGRCPSIIDYHRVHYQLQQCAQQPSTSQSSTSNTNSAPPQQPKFECLSPSSVKSPAAGPASVPPAPRTPKTPHQIKAPNTPLMLSSTDNKQNASSTSLPSTPNTSQSFAISSVSSMFDLNSTQTNTVASTGGPMSVPSSMYQGPPMMGPDGPMMSMANPLQQMERMTQESSLFEPPLKQSRLSSPRGYETPVSRGRAVNNGQPAAKMARLSSDSTQNDDNLTPDKQNEREEKLKMLKMIQDMTHANDHPEQMPPQMYMDPHHRPPFADPSHPEYHNYMMWQKQQQMRHRAPGPSYQMHIHRQAFMEQRGMAPPPHMMRPGQPGPYMRVPYAMQREMEMNQSIQFSGPGPIPNGPPVSSANKPVLAVPPSKRSMDQTNDPNMPNGVYQFNKPNQQVNNSQPPYYFDPNNPNGPGPECNGPQNGKANGPPGSTPNGLPTVNNTFLNANLSIQQVNIQNVGPLGPDHLPMHVQQQIRFASNQMSSTGGSGGPIPMRPPPPGADLMPFNNGGPGNDMFDLGGSYNFDTPTSMMATSSASLFQSVDPLTNLEGKVPTQKLQYFPTNNQAPAPNQSATVETSSSSMLSGIMFDTEDSFRP